MHIELTEMLRCPAPHAEAFLVMSTGEMRGRMVRSGVLACPVCQREYPILKGIVQFSTTGPARSAAARRAPLPIAAADLQALLDLSGPGGYVVLLGSAARHAEGLAELMAGIHFVGVNAGADDEALPVLSLLECAGSLPLRNAMARAVVVGGDRLEPAWLAEAQRVLLPGRRLVVESDAVQVPAGVTRLALERGMFVGERR